MPETEASPDNFYREPFLRSLTANIAALAKIKKETLATPRVITVSGEWGSGKTWIASALKRQLLADDGRKVVSIDVFRYDHHDDPFSVIASSIYAELRPSKEKRTKLLKAAGAVLQSAAPIAAKAALTLGARAIGISAEDQDNLVKEIATAAEGEIGKLSAKSVENLFGAYAKTQVIQEQFVQALEDLTLALAHPMVVLVDELDRCRPSFALELLERLKHLFNAENIVFVLFCNPSSLQESIRHTYGQGTDAERYLSKFVALDLPLIPQSLSRPSELHDQFIIALTSQYVSTEVSFDFRSGLRIAAIALQPTLRDIARAIQVWAQTERYKSDPWPAMTAYFLLLQAISPSRFEGLRALDGPAASRELQRLRGATLEAGARMSAPMAFTWFLAESDRFKGLIAQRRADPQAQLTPQDSEVLAIMDEGRALHLLGRHLADLSVPLAKG